MSRVSRRHVVLGILLLGAIAYLLFAMRLTSRPSAGEQSRASSEGKQAAASSTSSGAAKLSRKELEVPKPAAFSRYEAAVARNIFAPPAPPAPPVPPKPPPPPPLPSGSTPTASPRPKPPDFSGWTYGGYMRVGNRLIGVLQNDASDSVKELSVGDQFMGARVKSITSGEMVFSSPAGDVSLSSPRDFPVLSLSRGASGTPTAPRPAAPQPSPGQTQPPAPGPPGPPAPEE